MSSADFSLRDQEPSKASDTDADQQSEDGLARINTDSSLDYLTDEVGISRSAAEQIVEYLAASKIALGVMPTQQNIVLERFFDDSGSMQLIIHAPFGSRLNRAWGLALRKRFCRQFNFELQAAAPKTRSFCRSVRRTVSHSAMSSTI